MASRNPDADADVAETTKTTEATMTEMADHPTSPNGSAVAYEDEEWTATRSVDQRSNLAVGDTVVFEKSFSGADVDTFAHTSGDTNRLHLDDDFADGTRFGGRIAHGTLVSGLISAALARLPGVVVYLSQDTSFHAPASVGDRFTAECEIVEDLGKWRYRLTTVVTDDDGQTLIDGEAVVLVDELPTAAAETPEAAE
ncbi:Acyl dehydratase [Halogranum rubrum]|uniref:Acyl dehydratase n=1 Tax=Halogranum rubrum TaxID=553466 RepID=A0A1I4E3N0_9EURY|nr:MaoC family dehydratase [Halogranum rubrum]SFK99177.1 Acyl dehydratase [Halogranum rubrum]